MADLALATDKIRAAVGENSDLHRRRLGSEHRQQRRQAGRRHRLDQVGRLRRPGRGPSGPDDGLHAGQAEDRGRHDDRPEAGSAAQGLTTGLGLMINGAAPMGPRRFRLGGWLAPGWGRRGSFYPALSGGFLWW
uniref:Transcriptional regulator n=1 Tax=Parastrongyloides trichosuri TaxID=131310 RepID=A0A0N4Z3F4_PARTI